MSQRELSAGEKRILGSIGAFDIPRIITVDTISESATEEETPSLGEDAYNQDQMIELAKNDLNVLGGLAMPEIFVYLFPAILVGVWSLLKREVEKVKVFSQVALGIPRGHAKTTLIKLFILYCILYTNKRFILIIGRIQDHAENILSDVFSMLNESNIQELFGNWELDVPKKRNNLRQFTFRGRNIIVAAIGAGGSVRGLNLGNARPDIIILEDIQDAEDAKSEVISTQLMDWMIGTAMKAKSPMGCLTIFVGNMFPGKHCILRQLKDNHRWIKFISGAILQDGTALWEELRSLESLVEEFENDMASGKADIFLAEVMNDIETAVSTRFEVGKIQRWPWRDDEIPQGKMIIIDPSSGKADRDPCSIGRFEVFDGKCGLREVMEGNFSPGETIGHALIWALRHGIKLIVCESTAYQSTLLYWFNKVAEDLGISGIQFMPIHSTSIAKNSRITDMLRGLVANEQAIHDCCRSAAFKQIVEWKPLRRNNNDGILDLLTFAQRALNDYEGLMLSQEEIIIQELDSEKTIEHAYAF